jgi:hypothetical protein
VGVGLSDPSPALTKSTTTAFAALCGFETDMKEKYLRQDRPAAAFCGVDVSTNRL